MDPNATASSKRIKELEAMVADVIVETADTSTLVLFTGNDRLKRLTVIHTLTREPDVSMHGPSIRTGRLSADLLREVITDPTAPLVYVCGPGISKWDREVAKEQGTQPQPRFLESVLANLKEIGVPHTRIKREFYG